MSEGNPKRAEYRAPKLVRYGDMVKLTAAGSAGTNEPTSGPGASDISKHR